MGAYGAFVAGLKKGWSLCVGHVLPNIMLAFVLIEILERTGLSQTIGSALSPVTGLFGLPGIASVALLSAWFSGLAGAAVAAGFFAQGLLNPEELTVLAPALFLLGAQIQYMGRILAVIGVPPRTYPAYFAISLFNAALSMLVMRVLVGAA